ncbi:hypothetical protein A986_15346 [Pseudomonas fluorescens BRIP34879]|nr:hypothetical protein A986_15346 [Pseudomonas fluorescens BRIP34879]
MKQEKFGIAIRDKLGKPVLEVGSHVIKYAPEIAKKIGEVAAIWAQTEVNLNCLFAIFLNTTPDDAEKQLKKYNNAAKTTNAARELVKNCLQGEELKSVIEILIRLDQARLKRNRLQHDVWAKKGEDIHTLFAIHSDQYFNFIVKIFSLTESTTPENEKSQQIIDLADEFAETISTGYTVMNLTVIEQELNSLCNSLMKAMTFRISERSKTK